MHELSLCRGLLQQVDAIAAEHRAEAISRVTLRIGPLAGVEIPLLKNAFHVARQNTVAANAALSVEAAPLRIYCTRCDKEHAAEISDLRCPACASVETRLISGDELLLVSVSL
ncbi:MAG: hydrogenase maturation nickel metallochaperone HypA [Pseudomonadota bacterium]